MQLTADAAYRETVRLYGRRGLECLCGDVRMAARSVTRFYDRFFAPLGVGANQIAVLWAVMSTEPVCVKKLSGIISSDATTLTRNLKRLENDKLLTSAPGQDRRERHYRLSPQGQRLMAQALPRWEEAQASLTEDLGRAEFQQTVLQLLRLTRVT